MCFTVNGRAFSCIFQSWKQTWILYLHPVESVSCSHFKIFMQLDCCFDFLVFYFTKSTATKFKRSLMYIALITYNSMSKCTQSIAHKIPVFDHSSVDWHLRFVEILLRQSYTRVHNWQNAVHTIQFLWSMLKLYYNRPFDCADYTCIRLNLHTFMSVCAYSTL